jgi:mRNA interferase YafQ
MKIEYTKSFEKDLKRMKKQGKNIELLENIIDKLQDEISLDKKNRQHELEGNYKDHTECHIQPDWLLIYKLHNETIYLTRTGSHSELFNK